MDKLTQPRSLLFVPGDSERKHAKAIASGADAVIFDLEDSVASDRLPVARAQTRESLLAHSGKTGVELWVRVNPLAGGKLLDDLIAVVGASPDCIFLPKVSSATELAEVANYLSALETDRGINPGCIRLAVIATETPRALLSLHGYTPSTPRLSAFAWGAEDLAASLGASGERDGNGRTGFTFQIARSMCLIAAAACGVPAFDEVHLSLRDPGGLADSAARARQDGFSGKMAIHPEQIPIINSAFAPTTAEISRSQRVVSAFASSPEAGALSVDGAMVDRPHLLQAKRTLALAAAAGALADHQNCPPNPKDSAARAGQ